MSVVRLLFELAHEATMEWLRKRREAKAARERANRPVAIRACSRCREIVYTPGLVYCTKCGARLDAR